MNDPDFKKWLRGHMTAFPALDEWSKKAFTGDASAGIRPADIFRQWKAALGDVQLADAEEATRQMLRGDVESAGFSEHPKIVRRAAHENSRRRNAGATAFRFGPTLDRDNNERFKCVWCRDYGWAHVWHETTVRLAIAGELKPPRKCCITNVACDCEAGGRRAQQRGKPPRYDERLYCRLRHEDWTAADLDELYRWCAAAHKQQTETMQNYEPAFDAYNAP